VDQREVREDTRSFAEALRSVFRQSPDIILIGEMRDLETIRLALVLAETGHLILGTLHTQDTTNAISRIVSVFPTEEQQQIFAQLAAVLVGVVAQILVPTADGSRMVLACEVLKMNNALRNLIRERKMQQIYSVIQTGKDEGMVTMNESLRDLCLRKMVHPDLALERSPDPKELRMMLER
jgi:twitching motility protein PilT